MRNNKGFTLIEIIVAVALVAILSAAIAPSVLNNIAQGRVARTQSDVQAIGSAIARFKSDVGVYPRLNHGSYPDTIGNRIDFLASSAGTFPTKGGATVNWFGTNTDFTTGVITDGCVEKISTHLILGRTALATDSLYPRAAHPDDPNSAGFRGGVISADQPDPWGHKYVCNVAALGSDSTGQSVWVLSAGPNGVLETPVLANGYFASDSVLGDDIGFRIQ